MQVASYRRPGQVADCCSIQWCTTTPQSYLAQPNEHSGNHIFISADDSGLLMTRPTSTYTMPMEAKDISSLTLPYQSREETQHRTPPNIFGTLSLEESQPYELLPLQPAGSHSPTCPLTTHQTHSEEFLHPRFWGDDFELRLSAPNSTPTTPELTQTSVPYVKAHWNDEQQEHYQLDCFSSLCPTEAPAPHPKALAQKAGPQPQWKSNCHLQNASGQNVSGADGTSQSTTKQRSSQSHSFAERKYRENLNAKFTELSYALNCARYCPPSTISALSNTTSGVPGDHPTDSTAKPILARYTYSQSSHHNPKASVVIRKSRVMNNAIDYINRAELEMRHMETEIMDLKERVKTLEKPLTRASARARR